MLLIAAALALAGARPSGAQRRAEARVAFAVDRASAIPSRHASSLLAAPPPRCTLSALAIGALAGGLAGYAIYTRSVAESEGAPFWNASKMCYVGLGSAVGTLAGALIVPRVMHCETAGRR